MHETGARIGLRDLREIAHTVHESTDLFRTIECELGTCSARCLYDCWENWQRANLRLDEEHRDDRNSGDMLLDFVHTSGEKKSRQKGVIRQKRRRS